MRPQLVTAVILLWTLVVEVSVKSSNLTCCYGKVK
jgi:hypothetical protein